MRIDRSFEEPQKLDIFVVSEYSPDLTLTLDQIGQLRCLLDQFLTAYMLTKIQSLPVSASEKP